MALNPLKLTAIGLAAASFMMTAPMSAMAGDLDGQEIKVCTWGGSWRDIQKETIVTNDGGLESRGAKVIYVTGSPQANLAKLIASKGAPVCDVMEFLDAIWPQANELGYVVEELDFSQIPNAKDLPDYLVGKNFTGSWFTQEGICYNADKFKENGIPEPKTYTDLIHPKLSGMIQIPDITSGGGLANFGGIVKAAGGDEANVQPGLDLITKMNVKKFWSRGSESNTLLQNGDIWASIGHVGWCMRGHKAGQTYLKFAHPIIGDKYVGLTKRGYLSIIKSSDPKNSKAAHAYINGYLSEETQFAMSSKAGTIAVNKKALPRLANDPVLSVMAVLDPAEIAKEYSVDYTKADQSEWNDKWNRSVTR